MPTGVEEFNQNYTVMQLVLKKSRKKIGNKARMRRPGVYDVPSNKPKRQTTMSAKRGRKRALPARIKTSDQVKPSGRR